MIVLTAIGRFFKKIWDWIKQTAWIQPLLIVGVIFGIIFSIPAIVKAAQKGKAEKSTYSAYYNRFKLSLENEGDSKADQFTYKMEDILLGRADAEENFKEAYPDLGEKFFITYVEKKCAKCDEAKEGFSTFEKKLNKNESYQSKNPGEKFNMVTIFVDDENADTTEEEPAFWKYLERHLDFFAEAGGAASDTAYYINKKLDDSELEGLENADPKMFNAPTIFLVELGETAKANKHDPGITELMFGVEGSDKNEKAKTLLHCWNHTGDFSFDKSED